MASNHGTIAHLLPQTYKRLVSEWLEEDCPSFDYGGFVVGTGMAEARLLGKSKVSLSRSLMMTDGMDASQKAERDSEGSYIPAMKERLLAVARYALDNRRLEAEVYYTF